MSDFEMARQLDRAEASRGTMPTELVFEEVMKNTTSPPCSLNDFMDYLYYVEHNAESLQFFLWYCDYIQRWSKVPPKQKAMSPIWEPEKAVEPESRFITYSHRRERSDKMNKILGILEMDVAARKGNKNAEEIGTARTSPEYSSQNSPNFSRLRGTGSTETSPVEAGIDWQPFNVQPFRNEINLIVKQYIAESSPRQLNLSPKDREYCLQATEHTTHPSALLPAFMFADASLRGRSHPNFVRWSMSNSNRARVVFLRLIGALLVLLGFALDVVLIFSRRSHFFRIACIVLWWPGLTLLISAWKNLCLVLHFHGLRQLRPWEQDFNHTGDADSDVDEKFAALSNQNSVTTTITGGPTEKEEGGKRLSRASKVLSITIKPNTWRTQHKPQMQIQTQQQDQAPSHAPKVSTSSSTFSSSAPAPVAAIDPLRKPSLQTFGPTNEPEREPWARLYKKRTFMRRVFETTVPVRNHALQMLQDRTVLMAVVSGGLCAAALTVGSLFVPGRGLFL